MTKEELEKLSQVQFSQIVLLLKQVEALSEKLVHLEKLLMHEPSMIYFPKRGVPESDRQ
jgi:hypothetical protein